VILAMTTHARFEFAAIFEGEETGADHSRS